MAFPFLMLGKKAIGFILVSLGGFIVWNAINENGLSLNTLLTSWYALPIVMFGLFVTWVMLYNIGGTYNIGENKRWH